MNSKTTGKRVIRFSALVFAVVFIAGIVLWKASVSLHAAQAVPGHLKIVFTSTRDTSCPPEPVCELDEQFGELYVMNRSGKDPQRITFDSAPELGAVWSPDGKTIAYHSPINGRTQIFLTNPQGLGTTQLTGTDSSNDTTIGAAFPDWSPDGKSIVFHTPAARITKPDGHTYMVRDIFVINVDG